MLFQVMKGFIRIGGTGQPGATISVTGSGIAATGTVGVRGTWTLDIPDLRLGETVLYLAHTHEGEQSKTIAVTVRAAYP